MDTKLFLENFGTIADAPGGIERLRELIIGLAIAGGLSTMLDGDSGVKELIVECQRHRNPHSEMSEPRFTIPNRWAWVPLASIAEHQLGKMLNSSKMSGVERPYLRSVNVRQDGSIDLADTKKMLIPEGELEKYSVHPGDLFVNEGGDVGRNAIWDIETEQQFAFQNQLHRLRSLPGINVRFVQLVIRNAKTTGVIAKLSTGVTIQHFSASSIRKLAVPLPPKEEQERIVAKVDELMALCDELEEQQHRKATVTTKLRGSAFNSLRQAETPDDLAAAWERISTNWPHLTNHPDSIPELRMLLMAMATSGRIVSEDGLEESAYEVLKAHSKSFEALHGPWVLPENWLWATFSDVADSRLGKMLDKAKNTGEYRRYLRNTNVQWFRIDVSDVAEMRLSDAEYLEFSLRAGDLLICEGGEPGRAAVCDESHDGLVFQKALHRARPLSGFDPDFWAMVLRVDAASGRLADLFTGATIKHLTGRSLAKHLVPVPPVRVQKAIVVRVNELMAMCDELEIQLQYQQDLSSRLAIASTRLAD
jgi:type I restriction enzyme S subunit